MGIGVFYPTDNLLSSHGERRNHSYSKYSCKEGATRLIMKNNKNGYVSLDKPCYKTDVRHLLRTSEVGGLWVSQPHGDAKNTFRCRQG